MPLVLTHNISAKKFCISTKKLLFVLLFYFWLLDHCQARRDGAQRQERPQFEAAKCRRRGRRAPPGCGIYL